MATDGRGVDAAVIEDWLVRQLAQHLELPPDQLDVREPFTSYGLASRDALVLSGELEEWLGRSLSPTLVYDYPTIQLLARYLAEPADVTGGSAPPTTAGTRVPNESIAIVGVGCRLPGAPDPVAFWQLLEQGVDAIREVPASRWNLADVYDPDPAKPGKMTTRWGGFLNDVEGFDAAFFGVSAREAVRMDPQQRLLLEVAWEGLEDAGLAADKLFESPTGVFVGISSTDYGQAQFSRLDLSDPYAGSGNALSIAANRLSYMFGLHGPSLAVDTACSSSLVAVHLACRSLRDGECTLALVAGVNLILNPAITVNFSKAGFMAADGRCKAFDARGDGYVRSEGAALVVLKPLERALVDGDRIYAVIRGSAVNQDGRSNGLTAPSRKAQEAVLREAYARADISPGRVQYVECHGTGTALGDPIEVSALGTVLNTDRRADERCAIGSVKTNVGHLEAAAGITGLIKVALCLKHQKLPPSLHFETPNPHIPFDMLPVYVQQSLTDWPETNPPRIAGVSSFGFGGTNAHVVLEAAPAVETQAAPEQSTGALLLPLSARSPAALQTLAEQWQQVLAEEPPSARLSDLCYTAGVRRSHHAQRLAVVGQTAVELRAGLGRASAEPVPARPSAGGRARIAFVFSGQGMQYAGMARRLIEHEPSVRASLERCAALLQPRLGWSVLEVLCGQDESAIGRRLEQTAVAQPTLFALQVALAELWQRWGIEPDAVIGHSLGEIAAAHLAGVLTLADAAWLVCERGRVLQQAHGQGRMVAVAVPAEAAAELAAGHGLHVAAYNGPRSSVLSGDARAIAEVIEQLHGRGISARDLGGAYAFHHAHLAPLATELEQALDGLQPSASQRRLVSTLTGAVVDGQELTAHYWAAQVQRPVRFAEAGQALLDEGYTVFVEVGPQPVLGEPLRQLGAPVVVGSLRRGRDERTELLTNLGRLYTHGCEVAWAGLYPHGASVRLPSYPWQRKRYWLSGVSASPTPSPPVAPEEVSDGARHPLLGQRVSSPLLPDALFESRIGVDALPLLRDHRICGATVLPAAAYVELALAAADQALGHGDWAVDDLELAAALVLPDREFRTVQVALGPLTAIGADLQIVSRAGPTDWRLHATARLHERSAQCNGEQATLAGAQLECHEESPRDDFYRQLREHGLEYGPLFQPIRQLWQGPDCALGQIQVSADLAETWATRTAVLDGSLQVLGAAWGEPGSESVIPIPIGLERYVQFDAGPTSQVWAYARRRPADKSGAGVWLGDIDVFGVDGRPLAAMVGLRLKNTTRAALAALTAPPVHDLLYDVQWRPAPLASEVSSAVRGPWLVMAGEGRTAHATALLDVLGARGQCGVVLSDTQDLLATLEGKPDGQPWQGLVQLIGVTEDATDACASVLRTIRVLARLAKPPRLWLVTRAGQVLPDDIDSAAPTHAAVWGLAATLALELPELHGTVADVDLDEADALEGLVAELVADGPEDRVVLRGASRYVARLVRPGSRGSNAAMRLERPDDGVLENLTMRPVERRRPGSGEVEIEVRASGLNFRDVLSSLGLYPGEAGLLGSECAGIIAAIGPDVTEFKVGDHVVAVAPGSFATFAITRVDLVAHKPAQLTFEAGATIPVAFLTAAYALRHVARIGPGERVLIHSASGGVGLAAIQIARAAGAELFVTAGSDAKRASLRSLGIEHVMDSRSLDFADQVRATTGESGVDVVLSSLPGEHIPTNLSLLRRGGRYVEIGKIGIWSDADVARVRSDVAYTVVDMAEVFDADSSLAGNLLKGLLAELSARTIEPPTHRVFRLDNAVGAFRLMARAQHIGKLVFRHTPAQAESETVVTDATYLVTGGLGTLGLASAEWLVEQGARQLVLVGRSDPNLEQTNAVAALRSAGASVTVAAVDVADSTSVSDLVGHITANLPPLRGIIHAAGVLDDGVLLRQSAAMFDRVLRPKVAGAWNLHTATSYLGLDFFVCFSSIAAVLGAPGQANYAAANAFLDALMHFRGQLGLPGTSINWGPWTGAGMAAGQRKLHGLASLNVDEALAVLGEALRRRPRQLIAARIDWSQLPQSSAHPGGRAPLLEELGAAVPPAADAPVAKRSEFLQRLDRAHPTQREAVLTALLREEVAAALGLETAEAVDARTPLIDLGLDSLMAVELRNRLASATGRPLPATLLFDYPNLEAMGAYLSREIFGVSPDSRPVMVAAPDGAAQSDRLAELEHLSDRDMLALLEQKLATLGEQHV